MIAAMMTKSYFILLSGYAPVTVITFLDELEREGRKAQKKQEELEKRKEDAFDRASSAAGSSSERTFFIANYTDEQKQTSMTVERTALDVLDFALLSAERFIQIRKQKEKNQMERELAGGKELIISVYKGCIQIFIFGYFIAKNSKWFNELLICSFNFCYQRIYQSCKIRGFS